MNPSSSSDETYLEAYIEQLTTSQWTHQIRRTMDLIRDLDASCVSDGQQLKSLIHQFMTRVEDIMIQHFDVVEMSRNNNENDQNDDNDDGDDGPDDINDEPDEIDELFGFHRKEKNSSSYNNSNRQMLYGQTRKRARYGMRFVHNNNDDNNNYDTITNSDSAMMTIPTTEELFEYILQQPAVEVDPNTTAATTTAIKVTSSSLSDINNNDTNTTSGDATPPPNDLLLLRDWYEQIQQLQQNCLQKTREKCWIAQQSYEIIQGQVQRLDTDLQTMELLLQSTGEFPKSSTGFNTTSGQYQQQQEAAVSSSGRVGSSSQQHQAPTAALSSTSMSIALQSNTNPNTTNTASTSSSSSSLLAACQVTPGSEYILCKILFHDTVHSTFQCSDEDIESNKVFDLPESQVIVLHLIERLTKGDTVYAVYPDTTSFYQATVVVSTFNKKQQQPTYVMVQFVDDADEFGVTHDKAVPIQHVMIPSPQLLV